MDSTSDALMESGLSAEDLAELSTALREQLRTEELQTKAMLIMRSIQNTKGRVESFFEHKDVRYAK